MLGRHFGGGAVQMPLPFSWSRNAENSVQWRALRGFDLDQLLPDSKRKMELAGVLIDTD